ncbi:type IV secretory system conjugative DNA transfer family protein, partial [Escherichia coli]
AQRSWELIQALNARESTLNALYDFRPLISREGWLPPVIDEAQANTLPPLQTVATGGITADLNGTVHGMTGQHPGKDFPSKQF